jgi:hypothetical protein
MMVPRVRARAIAESTALARGLGAGIFAIANPLCEALFLHVSGGVDAFSLEEFTFGQSQGLLNWKIVRRAGPTQGSKRPAGSVPDGSPRRSSTSTSVTCADGRAAIASCRGPCTWRALRSSLGRRSPRSSRGLRPLCAWQRSTSGSTEKPATSKVGRSWSSCYIPDTYAGRS